MGGRYSALAPPSTIKNNDSSNQDHYFALAFREPDRIYLIHADQQSIDAITRSIGGDRSIRPDNPDSDEFIRRASLKEDGSYEIQLRGHPFAKFVSRRTAMRIKRVLCQLVGDLYALNWHICVCSDLTTEDYHTTWFFRRPYQPTDKSQSQKSDSPATTTKRIVSLSLSGSDSLTLVNAPERLRKALLEAVRFGYTYGYEAEETFDDDVFEVKLNGGPWETSMLEEGVWARKLLLEIFRQFSKCRYVYYAVADTKGTADSIFFIHQQPEIVTQRSFRKTNSDNNSDNNSDKKLSSPKKIILTDDEKMKSNSSDTNRRSSLSSAFINNATSGGGGGGNNLNKYQQQQFLNVGHHCRQPPRRSSWQEVIINESAAENLSVAIEPYPFLIEQFFMISLNRADSLRLIDAPSTVLDLIKRLITDYWLLGLRKETRYDMAYEFRLNGTPWNATGADAVAAQSLMTVFFERLHELGWYLLATLDMSRRRNDKSVFILRREPSMSENSRIRGGAIMTPKKPPPHHRRQRHFCLSMCDGDKIRVIRGDGEVVETVKKVVVDTWPYGLTSEKDLNGCRELQFNGNPWLSLPGNGNEPLSARVMLLEILRVFHAKNWRVVVSADFSARYSTPANAFYNPVGVDSWLVARDDDTAQLGDKMLETESEKVTDRLSHQGSSAEQNNATSSMPPFSSEQIERMRSPNIPSVIFD